MLAQIPDAEFRAPYDAVNLMEKLCQRKGYADPQALFRLATIYAVVGRFDEAMAIAEKARSQAAEAGDEALVAALTNLIASQARAKETGGVRQPGGTR